MTEIAVDEIIFNSQFFKVASSLSYSNVLKIFFGELRVYSYMTSLVEKHCCQFYIKPKMQPESLLKTCSRAYLLFQASSFQTQTPREAKLGQLVNT